jgi:ATP/maltotriose-dependent transcriptional regulator MalT
LNRNRSPEEIAVLHSRANAWFTENNLIDDAAKHAPAAFRDDEHRTLPDPNSLLIPPSAFDSPEPVEGPIPPSDSPQPLVEPLSNRELDVLVLLAQRLSNKEIADKLYISATTVKGHLQNIYGKLNVGKRREAVEKAKKIGILSI